MAGNTAIVLAAGSGKRMNSAEAKQYLMLKNKPVIWYALQAFEQSDIIDAVVLVVGHGEVEHCREHIVEEYGFTKVTAVIEGGAERYLSVWEALKWLQDKQPFSEEEYIFIHDGARPFVNEKIITDTYDAAKSYSACVAGMPVKDTIKIVDEDGFAAETPNRKTVWAVQTPQVFECELIKAAYEKMMLEEPEGITDDAMVVETMTEQRVKLVEGSYRNIKITTPEDLEIANIFAVEK